MSNMVDGQVISVPRTKTRELHVASTRGMQPATRLLEGVFSVTRGTLLQKERWSEVANVKV